MEFGDAWLAVLLCLSHGVVCGLLVVFDWLSALFGAGVWMCVCGACVV